MYSRSIIILSSISIDKTFINIVVKTKCASTSRVSEDLLFSTRSITSKNSSLLLLISINR